MSEPEPATDLLTRWQSGDETAAAELYRRYAERVCALARDQLGRYLQRRVDPDDIAQSVFRSFFRRSHEAEFAIDQSASLWRLLVTITLNKIRLQAERHQAKRRDVTREIELGGWEIPPEAIAHEPTPLEAATLAEEVEALFRGLKPIEAEIFRRCLLGESASAIADAVRCSRWTVRRLLDRLGHRLKHRLYPDTES